MLADEIVTYLAGQGLGLTIGSTDTNGLFAVPFPTEAGDAATCIIEYAGKPPIRAMGPVLQAPIFEQAKFQVLSRDISDRALDCRTLQKNVQNTLMHLATNLVGSSGGTTVYGYIEAMQPPFFLKYDENGRIYFASNYVALKQVSA